MLGVAKAGSTFRELQYALNHQHTLYKKYLRCLFMYLFYKKSNQEEWGKAPGFDVKLEHKPVIMMQKLIGDILITALNIAAEL